MEICTRTEALAVLKKRLSNRDHFVIFGVHADSASHLLQRFADEGIEDWDAWVDAPAAADELGVLHTSTAQIFEVFTLINALTTAPYIPVFTIPKSSVDAFQVAKVIGGHDIEPPDSVQDIYMISFDDRTLVPELYLDALDEFDPIAASQFRARTDRQSL